MTDRELMQQALEKLDFFAHMKSVSEDTIRLIADLRAALAEPVQEAGCHVFNVTVTGKLHEWEPTTFAFALRDGKHALYTAPPQRKPLTDEELDALAIDEDGLPNSHIEFARAIERAHGIGGNDVGT